MTSEQKQDGNLDAASVREIIPTFRRKFTLMCKRRADVSPLGKSACSRNE